MHFIKVHCIVSAKSAIKCLSKTRATATKVAERFESLKKYQQNPEKKRQAVKRRYGDKEESEKQYIKEKCELRNKVPRAPLVPKNTNALVPEYPSSLKVPERLSF